MQQLYGLLTSVCFAPLLASGCVLTFCRPAVSASICFCCSARLVSKSFRCCTIADFRFVIVASCCSTLRPHLGRNLAHEATPGSYRPIEQLSAITMVQSKRSSDTDHLFACEFGSNLVDENRGGIVCPSRSRSRSQSYRLLRRDE